MALDEYVYKKNFHISTKDADFKKDLRVSSLVNFFIQAAWLVVDMHTKRLKRSLPEAEFFTRLEMKHAINESIPTLKFDEKEVISTNYKVRYNDIDMNMHLTTVRYIDFMFDTYDIEFLDKNTPKEVTVNFIKEVPFGADLIMHRYEGPDVHRFELENLSNKLICFRAEVKYESSL